MNYQAGSRWEVTLAVRRALTANLQIRNKGVYSTNADLFVYSAQDFTTADAAPLQDDRSISFSVRGAQKIDPQSGRACRSQVPFLPIQHRLLRSGNERHDNRGSSNQRGGNEVPNLLRIPRR